MKKRYKGKGFAVILLTIAGLLAGSMTSYGMVYLSDAPYDWEGNADSRDDDSPGYADSGSGPGAVSDPAGEQGVMADPAVTQVPLTERYHDDYKIYEESVNGMFFFYTNVSNGGITDQSVTLDMPQNVFCSVEKDGAEYDYVPGQAFSEYGTYVVRVTAVEDTSLPFSEQKEYRALFRFRIQAKPPGEAQEGEGSQGFPGSVRNDGVDAASGWQGDAGWPVGGNSGTGAGVSGFSGSGPGSLESVSEHVDPLETVAGEMAGEEMTGEEMMAGEMTGEEMTGRGEDSGEESRDGAGQEAGNDQAQEGAAGEGYGPGSYNERIQAYDSSRGRYEVTFGNGRTLISNVPEGYMGPGTVELLVSEGEGSIYRNDELLEFAESMSFKDPGYYRLGIDGQMYSFVIASAVGSMDYYMAPVGMKFSGVYFEGEPEELPKGRYLPMREDGQYQIVMTGEAGEALEVVLRKDTQPPQAAVHIKGGTAQLQYGSDDIERVILEKNGELLEGFAGYTIDSPGSYRLTVVDEAGNTSSTEFSLRYRVNLYGIVAVVLAVLLIAGGVVFVIHVKKTVKVR